MKIGKRKTKENQNTEIAFSMKDKTF